MTPPGDPPQQNRVTIAQAMQIAIDCHNRGDLAQAQEIYRRILAAEPENHDALHLLGLAENQLGENENAADLIERAIALAPHVPGMHSNLGLVYQDLGRLSDAAACFQACLEIDPGFVEAHNNLALVQQELGTLEPAIDSYRTALELDPDFAEAHSNLGNAYKLLGRLDAAEASYRRAIDCAPDFAEAHNNLGSTLHARGRLADALSCFETALHLNPELADAHNNIGAVFQEQEIFDKAIANYRQALKIDPANAGIYGNLAAALRESGAPEEALEHHRMAIQREPENDLYWAGLAATVETLTTAFTDAALTEDLTRLLDRPSVDPLAIAPAVVSTLRSDALLGTAFENPDDNCKIETSALFHKLISLCPVNDLAVESALTKRRRAHLEKAREVTQDDSSLPFLSALAQHCFINEYIFSESEEETAHLASLGDSLETALREKRPLSQSDLLILATYRPLSSFDWAESLEPASYAKAVRRVIEQQVTAPATEVRLRENLRSLANIDDTVSRRVRQQYEENPYPRWTVFAKRHTPAPIGEILSGAPLRFALHDYQSPETPDVLIAGCGTGQQALLAATRYRGARILAVDLSRNSLAYAKRKTAEYGIDNINYAQADILGLDRLESRFDLIECVGVLHHMSEPATGWRVLADRLKPGGVLKIGLYSELARQDVVVARELIASHDYKADAAGIRQCREQIISRAASGDTEMRRLTARNSFYTMSEFRDLVFHVQEHRFTISQIERLLEALGLDFLGFEFRDPSIVRRFKAATEASPASLADWHRFEIENPDTFAGMYQFWVRKS